MTVENEIKSPNIGFSMLAKMGRAEGVMVRCVGLWLPVSLTFMIQAAWIRYPFTSWNPLYELIPRSRVHCVPVLGIKFETANKRNRGAPEAT